jgi:hypothetical protein
MPHPERNNELTTAMITQFPDISRILEKSDNQPGLHLPDRFISFSVFSLPFSASSAVKNEL